MSPERTTRSVRIDGRRLRSARTKQLIVEAYLALLRERQEIPTATAIAERAGYSVRSVFERFPDLHALRVAATDYAFTQGTAQAVARDIEGDRAARIRSHVETRAWICEQWLPLWRALVANQGDSAELKDRIGRVRQAILRRIELMYDAELSTLDPVERRQAVLAIDSLIDFESWARMRNFSGLSVEEAREVWIKAIDRLLPATPPRPGQKRAVS
ncbi:MAG: TetR/AcrR family transcriptional regulator [Proteobacteria bacterium]|nr:TetR/AcrR family transcriptional regulator [Pseudomonadota bacterium]